MEATNLARIGYGRIDILALEERLEFGTWLGRDVSPQEVTKLTGSFDEGGIQRYAPGNMMPLVIPRSSILGIETLPSQLGPNEKPPILNFIPGTFSIKLAGGQHRLAALKKYKVPFAEKAKAVERQLRSARDHDDGSLESCKRIELWETELVHLTCELEEYGFWGVAVYDEGESITTNVVLSYIIYKYSQHMTGKVCADGDDVAFELSRNRSLHQYPEMADEFLCILMRQVRKDAKIVGLETARVAAWHKTRLNHNAVGDILNVESLTKIFVRILDHNPRAAYYQTTKLWQTWWLKAQVIGCCSEV